MVNMSLVGLFIPTFLFVSITPGLCMMMAMSISISQGLRRALWMMGGELLGVSVVAIAAVLGVSAFLLNVPGLMTVIMWLAAIYLIYVATQMWQNQGQLAISESGQGLASSRRQLFGQGFTVAVSNPKAWAFQMALLPPFIDAKLAFWPQLCILIVIMLVIEFCSLMVYAAGGKALKTLLMRSENVVLLNRVAAVLLTIVAVWLVLG